jgi:hypothetical protein
MVLSRQSLLDRNSPSITNSLIKFAEAPPGAQGKETSEAKEETERNGSSRRFIQRFSARLAFSISLLS